MTKKIKKEIILAAAILVAFLVGSFGLTYLKYSAFNDVPSIDEISVKDPSELAPKAPATIVKYNGRWGSINKKGEWLSAPKHLFEDVVDFSDGLAKAQSPNLRWGFVNKMGDWVIKPKFLLDTPRLVGTNFSEDRAFIEQDFLYGIIDKKGNWVVEPKYADAEPFSDGSAWVLLDSEPYEPYLIDKYGNPITRLFNYNAYEVSSVLSEGLLLKENDRGKVGYINKDVKWVVEPNFDYGDKFSEGLAAVVKDGKCGFIDKEGNWAIEPKYDWGEPFSDGLSAVHINYEYGIIDKQGKWILKPKYEFIDSCMEEMFLYIQNGKFGFLNKKGKKVTRAIFDKAYPFSQGLAMVKLNGKCGYIDKKGKLVIKPIYEEGCSFIR